MRLLPALALIGQPCTPLLLQVTGPEDRAGVTFDGDTPSCDLPTFPSAAASDRAGASCADGDAAWSGGAGHPSIQAAVDAAVDGGSVLLCPGDHDEVVEISGRTLEISSLSGAADDTTLGGGAGTALRITDSVVTVSDLSVVDVHGAESGAITASDSDLRLLRVVARGNAGESGGALQATGGHVDVVDSVFVGNSAGYDGGALALHDVTCASVSGSRFEGNDAGYEGGAVALGANTVEGALLVESSTFSANTTGYNGGAVSLNGWERALFVSTTSTFDGNEAGYSGGAIGAGGWEDFDVLLDGSDFAGNHAGYRGGAVQIGGWADDVLRVTGGTFTANHADHDGGAIASGGWGEQTSTIDGAVFTGNDSESGGAVAVNTANGRNEATFLGGGFYENVASDAAISFSGDGWIDGVDVAFGSNDPADVASPCSVEELAPARSFHCDGP